MPSYAKFDIWQNTAGVVRQSIVQIVSAVKTDTFSTSSTSPVDVTGLSVAITPFSIANRILIQGTIYLGIDNPSNAAWLMAGFLARNGTIVSRHDTASNRGRFFFGTQAPGNNDATIPCPISFVDSPASISSLTYSLQIQAESPRTVYVNRGVENDGDVAFSGRFVSTIIAMEILG